MPASKRQVGPRQGLAAWDVLARPGRWRAILWESQGWAVILELRGRDHFGGGTSSTFDPGRSVVQGDDPSPQSRQSATMPSSELHVYTPPPPPPSGTTKRDRGVGIASMDEAKGDVSWNELGWSG